MMNKIFSKISLSSLLIVGAALNTGYAGAVDVELAAKGIPLYTAQCASCHGEDGKSETITGKALNARNFVSDTFKQGDSLEEISDSIAKGVPGTTMVAFAHLSEEVRTAIASYILSLRSGTTIAAAAPSEPTEDHSHALDIYKQICASCHGDDGSAQTPTGLAIKARDFTKGTYKQGDSIEAISKSIAEGVPATAMAPFPQISEDDRHALAKLLLAMKGGKLFQSSAPAKEPAAERKVSIPYAMTRIENPHRASFKTPFNDDSIGSAIYTKNCAECHGQNGEGGISINMVSAAPFYRVRTEALLGHDGDWLKDRSTFASLISKGLPGSFMPGIGTLTTEEMNSLYDYLKACVKKVQ